MYLATTDSYATGAKTAISIDHNGAVTLTRNSLSIGSGNYARFGPNPTWASTLQVGGDGVNGITRTASFASVVTTNGNLHLDCGTDKAMYLNYYSGTGGIQFGNGALNTMGNMTAAGALTMNSNITAYSDERVKTNWRNLQPNFIEQLAKVKHGIYDRTDQECTQIGVGAQSLRPVMEQAVIEDKEGNLSVAYGNAALVACIKLAERVLELEAKLEQLTKDKS
jgi:hypothetical protein